MKYFVGFLVLLAVFFVWIGVAEASDHDLYPPVEKNVVVFETHDTFTFGFDSHILEGDQLALANTRIDELAQMLHDNPTKVIRIEGHTDEVGTNVYNYALSQRRINYMYLMLLERGICEHQIVGVKYDELEPVADGHSDGAWQANRNVFLAIHEQYMHMGDGTYVGSCITERG